MFCMLDIDLCYPHRVYLIVCTFIFYIFVHIILHCFTYRCFRENKSNIFGAGTYYFFSIIQC